jgi:coproporphyrinogen III oxidase-like Fe-S oxidoreductase
MCAGAHGKITLGVPDDIIRTEKPRQPREYLDRLELGAASCGAAASDPLGVQHAVPRSELPFEFMLNALRLNLGFALRDFELRTGLGEGAIERALSRALDRGLIEPTEEGWRPTELGSRFLNDLQGGFLE